MMDIIKTIVYILFFLGLSVLLFFTFVKVSKTILDLRLQNATMQIELNTVKSRLETIESGCF